MEIKVLGPGCAKCNQTMDIIKEAVRETAKEVTIIKITDAMEIAKSGVFGTPAVIVDGQVKAVGKVPVKKDVLSWIGQ